MHPLVLLAAAHAEDVKAKMLAGNFVIFRGALQDNAGKLVIPAGASQAQQDVALEGMNYLVSGVMGTL